MCDFVPRDLCSTTCGSDSWSYIQTSWYSARFVFTDGLFGHMSSIMSPHKLYSAQAVFSAPAAVPLPEPRLDPCPGSDRREAAAGPAIARRRDVEAQRAGDTDATTAYMRRSSPSPTSSPSLRCGWFGGPGAPRTTRRLHSRGPSEKFLLVANSIVDRTPELAEQPHATDQEQQPQPGDDVRRSP